MNGAGKTTQLQIITGAVEPDSGHVIKSSKEMKIAFLKQEFNVEPSYTVREEFASVYEDQLKVDTHMHLTQSQNMSDFPCRSGHFHSIAPYIGLALMACTPLAASENRTVVKFQCELIRGSKDKKKSKKRLKSARMIWAKCQTS